MKKVICLIFSIGFVLISIVHGFSQEKPRTIDESNPQYNYPNQPVSIVARKIGDLAFEKNTPVRASKSWLKDVRLTIRNTSSKTLVWLWVELNIERQGKLSSQGSIPLQFGNRAAQRDSTGKLVASSLSLRPGETTHLSLSDSSFDYWMKYLRTHEAEDIDRVSLEIRYAHYDDGTGWALGFETRQNPNDLNEYKVVSNPGGSDGN
ncbi:MAG: hypothetical protein KA810_01375 [Pyrinomonadaceae bacterium]|nr:hypothetical protein [Pyrinomonadaceae bacterium]